ncbi:hypothetical protein [Lihuaxuella thermophila]|uniref:Uncharacterized protein n=1 Tax=Lihuaxuella thermophila TaxID=1173111 RepID=A0A1H8A979_9BACL|nr:hypothetical protein [Lihuaxuella thermophila]SEM67240.1 hypothetical protein SAMN05444955_10116 [Lihuaxuella thermophila]
MMTPAYEIRFDERLGIDRPLLHVEYEELPEELRQEFELKCQEVCARIPERIKCLEQEYLDRYEALKEAEDDETFYRLTDEMNDLSKTICDLNILFLYIEGTFLASSVHA